jgi:hypothetical protein
MPLILTLGSSLSGGGWSILPPSDKNIPLTNVSVNADLIDMVGHVKVNQTFINRYPRNIEAKYLFNLDSDSTVTGMTMVIGDRRLVSDIKEKSEARATYETAIAEKKTTCLLEKGESNGIYSVNVGNILENQEIMIEFEYITSCKITDEGYIRFLLPTNISPKYDDSTHQTIKDMVDKKTASTSSIPYSSKVGYSFKVEIHWKSANKIKEVVSHSNEITVEEENDCSVSAVGGIGRDGVKIICETAPSSGDFNVLLMTEAMKPTVYLVNVKEESKVDSAEAYLMLTHRIPDEIPDLEGGEFIILIDRSGSMGDSFGQWSGSASTAVEDRNKKKIDYAKEATKLFVQSLPAGCKFNIVSFGSSYTSLFPSSVEYTDASKQQALDQISSFGADMGGTELFQCLSDVLSGQTNRTSSNTLSAETNRSLLLKSNPVVDLVKRVWKAGTSSTTEAEKQKGYNPCFLFSFFLSFVA